MPSDALLAEPLLLGDQNPRILSCPDAPTSAGIEAADLAESLGLVLDPWQRLVLDCSLRERANGTWASFEVGLMVSRQNGKGTVLEARELAGLLLFGDRLIIHSAHEFSTALEAMRRLEFLLADTGEIKRASRSHGDEGFELKSGARIKFKTRTKGGGRGLSGDLVILDEAMILSSESMKALMPTLSARPNPQIWYTGSAVDQVINANGYVFAGVRSRGVEGGDPRLCYLEWSCQQNASQTDLMEWGRSNPGMGYRISPEYIEAEQRAFRHDPKGFDVERLGIGDWPILDADREPVIDPEVWRNMANRAPQLDGPIALALDRSPDRSEWSLSAAQRTTDGRKHVEIGYSRGATVAQIVNYVQQVVTAMNPVALAIDAKSPAAEIEQDLIEAGVEPVITNSVQLAIACGGFLNDALDGQLSHTGQKILTDAVTSAAKRELPGGGFAWDKAGAGSIAQLMAATLARWALFEFGPVTKPAPPPAFSTELDDKSGELDVLNAAF